MNEINASELLSQIRTLGRELQPTQGEAAPATNNFGDMLKTTINSVNEAQQYASDLKIGFVNGSTDKSLAEVMIASQKADLSFRAATEVRNKLVSAYQDIMNMPV
jgi:flagellar hook-basal body complex protein FliE